MSVTGLISTSVTGFGGYESRNLAVPRAAWEAMTPEQRAELVEEMVSALAANFLDDEDGGGAAEARVR